MKLSLNWLKEFVDLSGISPEQIRDELSLKTAEVEGFEIKGAGIVGVVVGEILEVRPHPTSRKPLSLLKVDGGKGIVPVVCGAPNCRVGMRVAFAPVGARLGELQIGKASLAGEESHGMCLSEFELGISSDHDGIVDLQTTVPNGTSINGVMPEIFDTIFEIDNKSLTNRPDLWGHYGIARELSVIFGRKLKPLPITDLEKFKDLPSVPVKIENAEDCYSFGAFRVDNITAKIAPSHVRTRLFYCGVNPHGFLVDLSNYIMLEIGQPNHAFDASKVGALSAGNCRGDAPSPVFKTLKDQEIQIKPDMLFIKSCRGGNLPPEPVSLAGIMGGANSLITNDTKDVVFEFATFNPSRIRKTSAQLGIRSDSSARYEKSLDTNLNKIGAGRAIKLLAQFDKSAKVVSNFNWQVANPTKERVITLSKSYLEKFTGIMFDYHVVKKNLAGLGFAPVIKGDQITVASPTWRATKDVTLAACIIEEIVRMHGYNNIPATPPEVALVPVAPKHARINFLKDLLATRHNMTEVHTYIWNGRGAGAAPESLRVSNSVGGGEPIIRDSMLQSILDVVSRNKGVSNIRIFEIGEVWRDGQSHKELGLATSDYMDLINIIRDLVPNVKFDLGKATHPLLHPKNNATFDGGFVGMVRDMDIFVACLSRDRFAMDLMSAAKRISKYPKTTLDFTITRDGIYRGIQDILEKFAHPLVTGFKLKDVYQNKFTIEFTVQSYEKTLTSDEIQSTHRAILEHLKAANLAVDE